MWNTVASLTLIRVWGVEALSRKHKVSRVEKASVRSSVRWPHEVNGTLTEGAYCKWKPGSEHGGISIMAEFTQKHTDSCLNMVISVFSPSHWKSAGSLPQLTICLPLDMLWSGTRLIWATLLNAFLTQWLAFLVAWDIFNNQIRSLGFLSRVSHLCGQDLGVCSFSKNIWEAFIAIIALIAHRSTPFNWLGFHTFLFLFAFVDKIVNDLSLLHDEHIPNVQLSEAVTLQNVNKFKDNEYLHTVHTVNVLH